MSFEKYLRSVGGTKFTHYSPRQNLNGLNSYGGGVSPGFTFGNPASGNAAPGAAAYRFAATPGYSDEDGNFLGYGSDADSLYANSPGIQRQYQEYVEQSPQRAEDDLRNAKLQEEYRILQQQALEQQRTQDLPSLANFNPAPQMGGGLMGQQPQQPQQQQPQQLQQFQQPMQQQGGLINYTHRGGMGGMGSMGGTAGGLHRGGLIAPSGSNGGGQ